MKILIYNVNDTPIGRGGMGQVYLGTDPNGNLVAVKEMLAQYVNDEGLRKRFHQEVNILKQLEHPAIVKMYASFEERGNLYLVMEYVNGVTVDEYVRRHGALSEKEAIRIISELLPALQLVHSNGYVHRDIKPGNIMLRPDGHVCLLDFGIAKDMNRSNGQTSYTTVGTTIGTVGYMSPEQAEGNSIDWRSDIYSLGCVLFYMLTGQHAIKEESNEIKTRLSIINNPFPSVKLYNPNISDKIQFVLSRATDKDMRKRFQSCSEFADLINYYKTNQQPKTSLVSEPKTQKTPAAGKLKKILFYFLYAAVLLFMFTFVTPYLTLGHILITTVITSVIVLLLKYIFKVSAKGRVFTIACATALVLLLILGLFARGKAQKNVQQSNIASIKEDNLPNVEIDSSEIVTADEISNDNKISAPPKPNDKQVSAMVTKRPGESYTKSKVFCGTNALRRVYLRGKYGYINEEEKEVIPLKYDDASECFDISWDIVAVKLNNRWGFIDKNGDEIIPFKYDDVCKNNYYGVEYFSPYRLNLVPVKYNGKWGFINKLGKEIIPFDYEEASAFSVIEELARVKKYGKYGFIDSNNNVMIPFEYDKAGNFDSERVPVSRNDKVGVIDVNNNLIVPFIYENGYDNWTFIEFSGKFLCVKQNGKWGRIDVNGKIINQIKYDRYTMWSSDGTGNAVLNGITVYLDAKGNEYSTEKERNKH